MTLGDLIAYRDMLQAELDAARAKEQRDIADCVARHASMPNNYWQPRYRLEEKLRVANKMVEMGRG
jgi:hypothetical protein